MNQSDYKKKYYKYKNKYLTIKKNNQVGGACNTDSGNMDTGTKYDFIYRYAIPPNNNKFEYIPFGDWFDITQDIKNYYCEDIKKWLKNAENDYISYGKWGDNYWFPEEITYASSNTVLSGVQNIKITNDNIKNNAQTSEHNRKKIWEQIYGKISDDCLLEEMFQENFILKDALSVYKRIMTTITSHKIKIRPIFYILPSHLRKQLSFAEYLSDWPVDTNLKECGSQINGWLVNPKAMWTIFSGILNKVMKNPRKLIISPITTNQSFFTANKETLIEISTGLPFKSENQNEKQIGVVEEPCESFTSCNKGKFVNIETENVIKNHKYEDNILKILNLGHALKSGTRDNGEIYISNTYEVNFIGKGIIFGYEIEIEKNGIPITIGQERYLLEYATLKALRNYHVFQKTICNQINLFYETNPQEIINKYIASTCGRNHNT
jgi:hypothetical protein